jgi:hypothetical protein
MSSFGIFVNLQVGAKNIKLFSVAQEMQKRGSLCAVVGAQNIYYCCPRYSINVLNIFMETA